MKLIKLTSILLSTSMIAGGFAPAFTTLVSAEVAKTASSTNTTEITSAVGADWTLNSNSTVKNAETILAQATNINLNSHTLTIDGGWYIAPGKSVEITGSGTVELTGEAYCGLPANATWGMIVVGNRGTEPNSASLTIESGVTVTSSTGNGATVLVTPSGKLTSSGIISNTAQTGNTTALTLGAEVNTANDTNGPEVTLNQNSKVNSQNGRAIHVLGYTRGAVLEAYGSSITGGSSRTGIGIYYAGSGKATISDCTISASLAILNIGGNFTISDPNISSTGTDTGTEIDYGSGYKGPNAAIVVALNNGNYNSSQAAIKLSGEGSLEDKNTSAHNSIMIYTREEDGVYEQNTTNKNNLDGNGATIVTMNSPQIDFQLLFRLIIYLMV